MLHRVSVADSSAAGMQALRAVWRCGAAAADSALAWGILAARSRAGHPLFDLVGVHAVSFPSGPTIGALIHVLDDPSVPLQNRLHAAAALYRLLNPAHLSDARAMAGGLDRLGLPVRQCTTGRIAGAAQATAASRHVNEQIVAAARRLRVNPDQTPDLISAAVCLGASSVLDTAARSAADSAEDPTATRRSQHVSLEVSLALYDTITAVKSPDDDCPATLRLIASGETGPTADRALARSRRCGLAAETAVAQRILAIRGVPGHPFFHHASAYAIASPNGPIVDALITVVEDPASVLENRLLAAVSLYRVLNPSHVSGVHALSGGLDTIGSPVNRCRGGMIAGRQSRPAVSDATEQKIVAMAKRLRARVPLHPDLLSASVCLGA